MYAKVFFEKKIDTSSMEEILKEDILAEKDSIVFYLGIKEMVPENFEKLKRDEIYQGMSRNQTLNMGIGEGQRSFISNRSFSVQYPLET